MHEPRSWLFVPADSEKKIAKALESETDALIFDLEDSVALPNKARARDILPCCVSAYIDAVSNAQAIQSISANNRQQ